MLRDDLMPSSEFPITSEEVNIGSIPDWLQEQISLQSLNPGMINSDLPGRIMIIYPNETSRRENLANIGLSGAIDTNLHHTIESLAISLLADFRFPRIIANDGPYEAILHAECFKESSRLGFPIINPIPEMNWGIGKTRSLANLFSQLSRELAFDDWEGPGITTFVRIIRRLEKKLGGTHPDMVFPRIIKEIKKGREPFSISDIDGIVLLDHAPGICKSHSEMILQLSRLRPVHQLTYPGNFRLGHHGILLVDEHPIRNPEDLPEWLIPSGRGHEQEKSNVSRVFVKKEAHSFDATIKIVGERLSSNSEDRIVIIDPAIDENREKWIRLLSHLGVYVQQKRKRLASNPLAHWILYLVNLPHGSDAFSLARLRALSLQKSITPFEIKNNHPLGNSIRPIAEPELLTNLARQEHILGGPGTLERWLSTMSRAPSDEKIGLQKECTQWWILCLANSLRPILCDEDRKALDDESFSLGCFSGRKLPLSESEPTGDGWLMKTLGSIDVESTMETFDGTTILPASVIQMIWRNQTILREMQANAEQEAPVSGKSWVTEFNSLCQQSTIKSHGAKVSGRVRILEPSDALGCSSELTILANTSSSSWNLKPRKVPFIGDKERFSMEILSPDTPIRDARHYLHHILFSSPEVVIFDSSEDEANPPSAPIREWAKSLGDDYSNTEFFSLEGALQLPRELRQLDGKNIQQNNPPLRKPLNPSALTIGLDPSLQHDRQRRQPVRIQGDGYLPSSAIPRLLSIDRASLSAKKQEGILEPRSNPRWPVVGGITKSGKHSATIDPRPFKPSPSGSKVSDSRHGHSAGAEQKVRIWSPTRLQKWLDCPRMGWLSSGLLADGDDDIDEEIDGRTQGNLLHMVHHDLISRVLQVPMGGEKETPKGNNGFSISRSNFSEAQLMQMALESLDRRAPWLERTDAVATHSLRSLTGMTIGQWDSWLAEPTPLPFSGRIGSIVSSESFCADSAPISLEWSTDNFQLGGLQISLPSELTGDEALEPIKIRGFIDRVDLLPFDTKAEKWIDEEGDLTIAPIRIHGSGWKPRRIVAIRDLKTSSSGSPRKRHIRGLLEELQLALYSRAWEEAHPGDLVVAAGISIFGHKSEHFLEISSDYSIRLDKLNLGNRTTITSNLHRFADESPESSSNHFRAWMAQRISVALKVASRAEGGMVHPTPSPSVCSYCPVSRTCNVMERGDFQ